MLEQAERAIDEFERKWPKEEYQMLVGFDNSSNHNAYAPDALKTAGLNVGDTSNRKAEMPCILARFGCKKESILIAGCLPGISYDKNLWGETLE